MLTTKANVYKVEEIRNKLDGCGNTFPTQPAESKIITNVDEDVVGFHMLRVQRPRS